MFLFSTDIDGTIYDGPESAETFARFWESVSQGNPPPTLVYNTGRSVADARDLIASTALPEPDFLIGGVGTEIFDFGEATLVEDWRTMLAHDWDVAKIKEIVLESESAIEFQPIECQNEFKSSWYWSNKTRDDIDRLSRILSDRGVTAQLIYSSNRDLDILPNNANKGNAIKWLVSRLGFPTSRLAVAGDSGNDSSMFLLDEVFGIVVANAEPALPQALDQVSFHKATLPCAAGVVEGLGVFLRKIDSDVAASPLN